MSDTKSKQISNLAARTNFVNISAGLSLINTYLADFNVTLSSDTSKVILSDVNVLLTLIKQLTLHKANNALTVVEYCIARHTSTKLGK